MGNSNKKDPKINANPPVKPIISSNSEKPAQKIQDNYVAEIGDIQCEINGLCLKCDSVLDNTNHFKLPKCNHTFCKECLCNYLKDFSSAKMKCLQNGCSKFISDSIFRQCLSEEQIEKYDRYCNPSQSVKCLIKDCPFYFIPESNEVHLECSICKQPNCVSCHQLHLATESCGISPNKNKFEEDGAQNLKEIRRLYLLQLEKDRILLLNPDVSNCQNCDKFLSPRTGMLIVPCMHTFCRDCVTKQANNAINILHVTCLGCDVLLESRECRELVGDEKLLDLNLKAVESKFFLCQTPDCKGLWDKGDFTGVKECPLCGKSNCIPCYAIHEGQTCAQYKTCDAYKKIVLSQKIIEKIRSVQCYNCNSTIYIKEGGCNAMKCQTCKSQVCAFTGLQVGPNGCKCTPAKPCHKDCTSGCMPD